MPKRENTEEEQVLHLTAEQQRLIQHYLGKSLEILKLDDCGDRIVVTRACEPIVAQETSGNPVLILDLTGEQKRQLRRLTGKRFSQLRIHRRAS